MAYFCTKIILYRVDFETKSCLLRRIIAMIFISWTLIRKFISYDWKILWVIISYDWKILYVIVSYDWRIWWVVSYRKGLRVYVKSFCPTIYCAVVIALWQMFQNCHFFAFLPTSTVSGLLFMACVVNQAIFCWAMFIQPTLLLYTGHQLCYQPHILRFILKNIEV